MFRILFYLPLLLSDWIKLLLPRKLFIYTYTKSNKTQIEVEQKIRNLNRMVVFYIKKRDFFNDY